MRLYTPLCRSVRRSIRRSVRPLVRPSVCPSDRPSVGPELFPNNEYGCFGGWKSWNDISIIDTMSDAGVVASDVPARYLFFSLNCDTWLNNGLKSGYSRLNPGFLFQDLDHGTCFSISVQRGNTRLNTYIDVSYLLQDQRANVKVRFTWRCTAIKTGRSEFGQ